MARFEMEIPDGILEETLLALCDREGGYKATIINDKEEVIDNPISLTDQAREAVIRYIKQSVANRREQKAREALVTKIDDIIIE